MEKRQSEPIDLLELLYALKRRVVILIAALLGGALLAGVYTQMLVTPIYSATATVLVLTERESGTSLSDLQLGSQLTTDAMRLIKSNTVLQQVIDNLGLNMNYKALRGNISISNESGTRILDITVSNPDPETARELAEEIADVSADFIADRMGVEPPRLVEEVELPQAPVSPSLTRNVAQGALLGFILAAGVICMITIMDDTIKSEDDITKYLGVPALASIPDRKDYISGGTKKKSGKKKKKRRKH